MGGSRVINGSKIWGVSCNQWIQNMGGLMELMDPKCGGSCVINGSKMWGVSCN